MVTPRPYFAEPGGDIPSPRSQLLLLAATSVVIWIITDDILGWINGGGIFSIVAAEQAAKVHSKVVDVDGGTLRSIFILLCSVVVVFVGRLFNVEAGKRLFSVLIILGIMGGGCILDNTYDEAIVSKILTKQGYFRCTARDFHVGNGKSRVWFNDYVLLKQNCPSDKTEAELNQRLPRRTGIFSRLDYVTKGDLYVTYAYTLTDSAGLPLDQHAAAELAQNSRYLNHVLKSVVCANRQSNFLRTGRNENFRYAGESGLVRMISVAPKDCD